MGGIFHYLKYLKKTEKTYLICLEKYLEINGEFNMKPGKLFQRIRMVYKGMNLMKIPIIFY